MHTDHNFTDDINKRFHSYFVWLCLFSLIIGIANLMGEIKSIPFFGGFSANSWLDTALFVSWQSLSGIAFWVVVGLTFNALRSAMIAFALGIAITLLLAIDFYAKLLNIPITAGHFFACIPFLVFGILYFKNSKAIYLILIPLATIGMAIATDATPLLRLIDAFTDVSLFMKIHSHEGSYHELDPLRPLLTSFITPLTYLLTFYFISVLQKGSKNFFAFTDCTTIKLSSSRDYSIIYWLYRILFFVVAIGIFSFLANQYTHSLYEKNELSFLYIGVSLFCYVLGVYVCVSIYRNYIASYFYYYNKPLSWNYFFLNIPVVNIIAWIISLKNSEAPDPELENNSNNAGVKILLSVIFILLFAVAIIQQPAPKTWVIIEFMFGFILLISFFQFKEGVYFLLAVLALTLFIVALSFSSGEYNPPSLQLIFTLFIIYPVFHKDIFSFKSRSTSQKIYKHKSAIDCTLMDDANKKFKLYFVLLFFFALITGLTTLITKKYVYFGSFSPNIWLDSAFFVTYSSLNEVALWVAVGFTFNAFRSAMITLAVVISLSILRVVSFYVESLSVPAQASLFLSYIPYVVFGAFHFKIPRAIYLLLIPSALIGIATIISSPNLIENISVREILISFMMPLNYVFIFYFVSALQQNPQNFITLADCNDIRLQSRNNYPIIYWLYPLVLFVVIVGLVLFKVYLYRIFRW